MRSFDIIDPRHSNHRHQSIDNTSPQYTTPHPHHTTNTTTHKVAYWIGGIIGFIVVGSVTLAILGGNGYPSSFNDNFVTNCEQSSLQSQSYCGCVLNALQQQYSYDQAQQMLSTETATTFGRASPALLHSIGPSCTYQTPQP